MTTKEAKNRLSRLRQLDRGIAIAVEEMASLRAVLENVKAQKQSGMPHTNSESRPMEDGIAKLDALERKVGAEVRELCEQWKIIKKEIDALPNEREQAVLRYRYLLGWKWEKIAVEMHYGYRHVLKLHGSALQSYARWHTMAHSGMLK